MVLTVCRHVSQTSLGGVIGNLTYWSMEMSIDVLHIRLVGRNPDAPSDRRRGIYTEQIIEVGEDPDICGCMTSVAKDNLVMEVDMQRYRIRRLTPRECGRLMAVPDRNIDKMLAINSNTQCYKQYGNSIVVTVLMAIFSQMGLKGVEQWNNMSEDEIYRMIEGNR